MANIKRYTDKLTELQEIGNYRILRNSVPQSMLNLSSNDYLGLNNNSQLYQEFLQENISKKYRFSSASSRLLTGNSAEYTELEKCISTLYKKESCLIYNSGYHANCGILPALAGANDLILADKLVHASIIDGLKLGSAKWERFRHLDYAHLEKLLELYSDSYENIFIVTESIFSMDGDIADLPKLVEIKKKYNAFLYVDEAHALGGRGNTGLGLVEENNCIADCDFIVGTFGKAIASVGAFVVCQNIFKEFLINHSRTLIFTTALPPINLAWTNFIMQRLASFNNKRIQLQQVSSEFAALLQVESQSHIIPYIIGENIDAIATSETLQKHGFYVLPIRYPTVAKGTARLRFSLQADYVISQIEPIMQILKN